MNPINVSRVVNNPALQQNYTIQRNAYQLANEGEWTQVSSQNFASVGVVTDATANDRAQYLSEGQRALRAITIYSPTPIYMADGNTQEADVVIWSGEYFRVQFSKPFQSYGYWFAIATRFVHAA